MTDYQANDPRALRLGGFCLDVAGAVLVRAGAIGCWLGQGIDVGLEAIGFGGGPEGARGGD